MGDVIVVDQQQYVRALLREPRCEWREVLEDGRPHGVVPLVAVVREADGRRVRGCEAPDDACHAWFLVTFGRAADGLRREGPIEITRRAGGGASIQAVLQCVAKGRLPALLSR